MLSGLPTLHFQRELCLAGPIGLSVSLLRSKARLDARWWPMLDVLQRSQHGPNQQADMLLISLTCCHDEG